MYIGLFDQNLLIYPNAFIPSLELMKYSYYFKRQNNIVRMFYDANEVEQYDKVIVSNDSNKENSFPKLMILNPKVEWIGKLFFNGEYHRLPLDIELSEADKSIYEPYFFKNKNVFGSNQRERLNSFLKSGSAYRLTHNGEIIYDLEKIKNQSEKIYLYDKNIFDCKNPFEIFSILNNKKSVFIETQRTNNYDYFLKFIKDYPETTGWGKDNPVIAYYGKISKRDFKKEFINFSRKFVFGVSDFCNEKPLTYFAKEELITKANYFLYGISKDKKIIFVTNPKLENYNNEMLKILNCFCSFTRICGKTTNMNFYDYSKKRGSIIHASVKELGKQDKELNKIFSANINTIHETGVWLI